MSITYRTDQGGWGIEGVDLSALPPKVYAALHKLCEIEHPQHPTVYEAIRSASKEQIADRTLRIVDSNSPIWLSVCACATAEGKCKADEDYICDQDRRRACLMHYLDEPYLEEVGT